MMRDGLVHAQPFEVRARVEAASDLLEQVDVLLSEPGIVPAVAVMLAGAALEEFLRSLYQKCSVPVVGDPTISKLTTALRSGGIIDKNDEKELTSLGGTRNEAAHGHFDKIRPEGAQVFRDRVSLFIRQKSS